MLKMKFLSLLIDRFRFYKRFVLILLMKRRSKMSRPYFLFNLIIGCLLFLPLPCSAQEGSPDISNAGHTEIKTITLGVGVSDCSD